MVKVPPGMTPQQVDQTIIGWAVTGAFAMASSTRDSNGVVTTAAIIWPDGATGTYTADTISTAFPGSTDAWHATHILAGITKTVTQTAVTRNVDGSVSAQPIITIT